jgi:gamma-glutamyl hercynylcysteine S-oxide synthase
MSVSVPSASGTLDREAIVQRFLALRRRTRALFDLLVPEAYYMRPIPLRHPVVFYEGHLPAFAVNTLVKRGLGRPGIDAELELLFARGIDPDQSPAQQADLRWPRRDDVRRYVDAAETAILEVLRTADLERPGHPLLERGQAVHAILEHEALHQETLLYMWHQLPQALKRRPAGTAVIMGGDPPAGSEVTVPAGRATLGADPAGVPFGWDNEFPPLIVEVPEFRIDVHDVTNQAFLEFVKSGGYGESSWWSPEAWDWIRTGRIDHPPFWDRRDGGWFWRGMFETVPLPPAWPVYVSHGEAAAYARWAGKRLPSEAEYHRAAYGTPAGEERPFPWGSESPGPQHGNFDFQHWDPIPAGSCPAGRSAWGIHDLAGNGWEWTSTIFDGLPGFRPMTSYPEYSAEFFDGRHYVMKGASPVTDRAFLRRSFRNWFRPQYPYVYATFRCVAA